MKFFDKIDLDLIKQIAFNGLKEIGKKNDVVFPEKEFRHSFFKFSGDGFRAIIDPSFFDNKNDVSLRNVKKFEKHVHNELKNHLKPKSIVRTLFAAELLKIHKTPVIVISINKKYFRKNCALPTHDEEE